MEETIKLIKKMYEEKVEKMKLDLQLLQKEKNDIEIEKKQLENELIELKESIIINSLDSYDIDGIDMDIFDIGEYHCKKVINKLIEHCITDIVEWQRIILKAKKKREKKQ